MRRCGYGSLSVFKHETNKGTQMLLMLSGTYYFGYPSSHDLSLSTPFIGVGHLIGMKSASVHYPRCLSACIISKGKMQIEKKFWESFPVRS